MGEVLGTIHSNSMDRFGPTRKVSKKLVHLSGGPLFPVGPVCSLVKWIAPIEIGIHLAVARVGEFVRDKARLGELRRDKEICT